VADPFDATGGGGAMVSRDPRAGVTATRNGSTVAELDTYFSDSDAGDRLTADSARTSTFTNGSALIANGGQAIYSGTGGEPMGCTWPTVNTTTVPGVVFFAEIGC